ncbi:MAG: zf-HC2 domain-containing protein [Bryobacteraceae bacterium]
MSRTGSHPADGDLLRYADGELTPADSRRVRGHLDACWQCRAELSEIEQTIGRCVRYRNEELAPRLPEPPAPWMDIHARVIELDQVLNGRPWYARVWEAASGALVRQRAWATAVAMLLIGALVVNQLRNAPTVRAAELLEKAARAQAGRVERVAEPRRIEVRTGARRAVRTVGSGTAAASTVAPSSGTLAAVAPLFARARYDWADPLSAASFARWRDGLAEKRDEVTTIRDAAAPERRWYRVRTSTKSSYLESAMLQIGAEDLRPVEAAFEFGSQERVEISDLGPAPELAAAEAAAAEIVEMDARRAPPAASALTPMAPRSPAPAATELERPATAGEELEVLAALHRLGADLGEPVEVAREGARVIVKGLGVNPELGRRIAAELASMPHALVRLEEPAGEIPGSASSVVRGPAAGSGSRWQREIETQLGGRAEYDQFVDRMLSASEQLMVRMHALRRLAERFGPATVAQLTPPEQAVLQGLVREHTRAAMAQARVLDTLSRPVIVAMGVTPTAPAVTREANWQAEAAAMFGDARRADRLVAAILGGMPADGAQGLAGELPEQLLSATSALRLRAAEFSRQTLP